MSNWLNMHLMHNIHDYIWKPLPVDGKCVSPPSHLPSSSVENRHLEIAVHNRAADFLHNFRRYIVCIFTFTFFCILLTLPDYNYEDGDSFSCIFTFTFLHLNFPLPLRIAIWKSLSTIASPIFYIISAEKERFCKMPTVLCCTKNNVHPLVVWVYNLH